MSADDSILRTALLDLACELESQGVSWILSGGYGLYLKQVHLAEAGERTLIPLDIWPRPRATNDLDIFLKAEVVVDAAQMLAVRESLDRLGYLPVEEAKYLQFEKALARGRAVKIDLHVGPAVLAADLGRLHIKKPRVRPKGDIKIHAHLAEDAVAIEEAPLQIPVDGVLSDGRPGKTTILVPQGFTYLLMKLSAFRDRKADPGSDMARHHALDLFRIVAMLTEAEYRRIGEMAERYSSHAIVGQARQIVAEDFSSDAAVGVVRLREHPLFTDAASAGLEDFMSVLRELFPPAQG